MLTPSLESGTAGVWPAPEKQNGPRTRKRTRAAGGIAGIDQEVVTLRGLFGNSGSRSDLVAGWIAILTHR